jgi:DNA mismatch endonuclease (patch repair protein)
VADTISKTRRSQNMRQIRSTGTKPETYVFDLLRKMNRRFQSHVAGLPGKPDIVFPRSKKIIEVRGCFWHQHRGCMDSHVPKSKISYWLPKLRKNVQRDTDNLRQLRKLGWRVLVVWECDINVSKSSRLKSRLVKFLRPKPL